MIFTYNIKKSVANKFIYLIYFILFLLLLFLLPVYAQNSHMKLLAVTSLENGSLSGGIADLYLEIREGTGRIYLDTYPLSKFDTQLSVRFAKEIACKFAKIDCSAYDFLYTINADSQIIGGPSAGAAIAVLTFAKLKGLDVDEDVAITGTINSGRIIGNVGGIKEKIDAANAYGIKKVLIPIDEVNFTDFNELKDINEESINENLVNQTENNEIINETIKINNNTNNYNNSIKNITKQINLIEYGYNISGGKLQVIPVSDLEDALLHFTGKSFHSNLTFFEVDDDYTRIMEKISIELCNRTDELMNLIENLSMSKENIENLSYLNEQLNVTLKTVNEMINRSKAAYENKAYYSSSSQCFGANTKLMFLSMIMQNHSDDYYIERINSVRKAIDTYRKNISSGKYETIPALQTALIVLQRIDEAEEYLKKSEEFFIDKNKNSVSNIIIISGSEKDKNNSIDDSKGKIIKKSDNSSYKRNESLDEKDDEENYEINSADSINKKLQRERAVYYLSLSIERLKTSALWSKFFEMDGKKFKFNNQSLGNICFNIIENAKSRIQYSRLYVPIIFVEQEKKLDQAYATAKENPYYCIAKATTINAEINAIISSFGLKEENLKGMIERKLKKAREVIAEETQNKRFPILGYSYYEYSQTLKGIDDASSLIYSEYALELSNLDLYFNIPRKEKAVKISFVSYSKLQPLKIIFVITYSLFILLFGILVGASLMKRHYNKYYSIKKKYLLKNLRKSRF